jgi:hypothetical protein
MKYCYVIKDTKVIFGTGRAISRIELGQNFLQLAR